MEFSDQALVVQVGKFKEADLWVRFLSAKRGLFTAFAFGGCRSQNAFAAALIFLIRSASASPAPKKAAATLTSAKAPSLPDQDACAKTPTASASPSTA